MRHTVIALCTVVLICSAVPALAQQGTGQLRGRIVDQQGAILPGATVVARNEESGIFREIVTGSDGTFLMSALTPGTYEVTANLQGFRRYQRKGLRVEVGKTLEIDVPLAVGGVEEVVTVTAESPIVDATSKQLGGSVTAQELTSIPSLNRNFTSYLSLLPGVTATISTDSFGADSVRVNGQNVRNVSYALDGAGNNDNFNNGNGGAQARVPVEAVQEFQLLTSSFDAEFGMAGGVVNAVSKQGSNRLHGTGFTFFQNQDMTVRDYFADKQNLPKPDARQVQYGGNLGGPIIRDKLHFFVNLERIDQNRGRTINIVARPELNFTTFTHDNVWNWMARVDHQINANNTWAVRWLRESSPQTDQYVNTNQTRSTVEQENDVDWTVVGTWNSVLGRSKVNVLKVSYTHEDVFFGNPGYFASGNQASLDPELQHQSFTDGISTRANRRMDPAVQVDETFSWFLPDKKGDHDVKFGAGWYYLPLHTFNAGTLNGSFRFSASDADFNPADARTYPDRLNIRVPGVSDFIVKGHQIGFFAQDKWKVTRRLTASIGLRYDLEQVDTLIRDNYLFAEGANPPLDTNNFSPRLGATYKLDEWSIIRGGWGIYYQKTPYSVFNSFVTGAVYSDSFTVNFPTNGVDPGPSAGRLPTHPLLVNGPFVNQALLDQMFPPGTTQKNTGTVNFDSPGRHLPYSRQATIGYEREVIRNVAVSADFVYVNHRDLYLNKDLNPGLATSTSRTAQLVRTDPNFTAAVLEITNLGWADYKALQLSVNKRFSRGYSFRVSYTRSKGYGNTPSPGNIDTIDTQVLDQLNLEQREGPTSEDRPHVLSIDGSVLVPHTYGLTLSGVVQYNSGTPFTLTNSSTDPDRNGFFQEPLAAGTYTGTGSDAYTVDYKGGVRGGRGPDYALLNMRAGWRIPLPQQRFLQVHVDVFNVTNRANFNTPSGDQRTATTFLILRSILNGGPTRTAQLNFKYSF
jgi:Carboxypeptidase regulatory-like domain/TonB dependent receptor-like, beta-barrel/TonB-dependent Receptor Plug Domain